jgi:hypothetical protein
MGPFGVSGPAAHRDVAGAVELFEGALQGFVADVERQRRGFLFAGG